MILFDYRMPNLNGYELCTKLIQLNHELAEILGIDVYVGEIIYNETKKASSNVVNSNSLTN